MQRCSAAGPRLRVLLLAGLVALAGCRSDEEEARRYQERGEELLAAGEARAGFLELKNALERDPTSAQINFLLAEALVADRQAGNALFYYQEARRLDPARLDAYLAEARILARGRPAEARKLLEQALELQSGSVEAWRLSARVSLFERDAGSALDAARRAVELAPEDFEAQLLLGQAHAASARAAGSEASEPDRAALGEALAAIDHAVGFADEKLAWRAHLERARLLVGWPERAGEAPAAFREALASSAGAGGSARVAVGEAVFLAGRRLEDDELRRLALVAIVDADPGRLEAWQALASFEESHGGNPGAIYRRLLHERPEDAAAHVAWARHLASEDRGDEAFGSLRRAIERGIDPPVLLGAQATLQLELGRRDAARATMEELEGEYPDHPRTKLAMAQAQLHDGKAPEAAEVLRTLVGTHESSEAQRLLALAELRSGNREAAVAAIDRSLELAPSNIEAHRLRARIRYESGQFQEALEEFQTLTRVTRLSREEQLLVARCFYSTGDPSAGRRVLEVLAAADPPHVPAALELARREAQRDPEAAEQALAQAEAAAPHAPAVLHQRTLHDLQAGDPARALARLDRAAASGPLAPLLRLDRARILARLGRLDEARTEAQAVFEEAPGLPGASQLLVALYGSQGRVGEATARLEGAEAKGELRPAARILLGRLQVERGETTKARAIFEEVLRSNTDLPLVKSDLAYLLALEGAELERAIVLARDAQAALPDDPEVLDTMGYVELRRGNPAVALVHLQRATTLAEEAGAPRAVHFYHLGLAHREARQNPSAVEAFDRALSLEPEFPEAARAREDALALAGGAPTSSAPRP